MKPEGKHANDEFQNHQLTTDSYISVNFRSDGLSYHLSKKAIVMLGKVGLTGL